MSPVRKGLLILAGSYGAAVASAAAFSGTVVAPIAAVPIAIVGGALAAHFYTQ